MRLFKGLCITVLFLPLLSYAKYVSPDCSDSLGHPCSQPFNITEADISKEQAIDIARQALIQIGRDPEVYVLSYIDGDIFKRWWWNRGGLGLKFLKLCLNGG